ncbi:HAD-IIA family hydrolase [Paenibacillus filicis]|uniref:HAD-IIA family hydrolase n=1 Tax=Paenibacillus gyeongsangnamensis TaxID=3388067 RepID=A0ABT4QAG7_9BACL|nr:HAD-IIA family hydrolase [Paenibacillus filicis]MCZ8513885.1 HAD-IIA family hydrolase [Paenibacillus filicis]
MNEVFHPGIKVYFFDLDGCIYLGNKLALGVKSLLHELDRNHIQYSFITNNSRQTAREIAEKLKNFGLDVAATKIIPVTDVIGKYLKEKFGTVSVKTVGSANLNYAIAIEGHRIIPLEDKEKTDVIVVGRDVDFTYEKLQKISEEVGRGSLVIGTNSDLYHPGEGGKKIPETGAIIAAIQAVTGTTIEYIGKPEPYLFLHGLRMYGTKPDSCVMIGDNLDTDILGGRRVGMKTVWVTNNVNKELSHQYSDLTVRSIYDLYEMILKPQKKQKEHFKGGDC